MTNQDKDRFYAIRRKGMKGIYKRITKRNKTWPNTRWKPDNQNKMHALMHLVYNTFSNVHFNKCYDSAGKWTRECVGCNGNIPR